MNRSRTSDLQTIHLMLYRLSYLDVPSVSATHVPLMSDFTVSVLGLKVSRLELKVPVLWLNSLQNNHVGLGGVRSPFVRSSVSGGVDGGVSLVGSRARF